MTTNEKSTPAIESNPTAKPKLVMLIDPPPSEITIPRPPNGFMQPKSDLRGVKPRSVELRAVGLAIKELQQLTDYKEKFGTCGPPQEAIVRSLIAAHEWTLMRRAIAQWDDYCRYQEDTGWRVAREHMANLKPIVDMVVKQSPPFAYMHPALMDLLGGMAAIGKKGAASRKANRISEEAGGPPVRGVRAKQLARAAKLASGAAGVTKKKR